MSFIACWLNLLSPGEQVEQVHVNRNLDFNMQGSTSGRKTGHYIATGTTRKMSQRCFCPAEYTLSQNLKLITLTLTKLRVRVRGFG